MENIEVKHLKNCPICGSNNFNDVMVGMKDRLYKTCENDFSLVCCNNCGHFFTKEVACNLAEIYPSSYEAYNDFKNSKQKLNSILGLLKKNKITLDILRRFLPGHQIYMLLRRQNEKKIILDVGCANGKGLYRYKKIFPENIYHGFDITDEASAGAKRCLDKVFVGDDFLKFNFPCKYDVVRMSQVLEHIEDTIGCLNKVNNMLKPGGLFLIGIPNIRSLCFLLFKKDWYGLDIPRHLQHFSDREIKRLLANNGFEKIKIEHLQTPRFFIKSFLRKFNVSSNCKNLFFSFFCLLANFLGLVLKIFRFSDSIIIEAYKKNS